MLYLQSFPKLTTLLILIALVMAACGGDAPADNPTPESQNVEAPTVEFLATDAPTVAPTITPSPVLPPPTAVPLDVQLGDMPAGEYSLSMVGALNSDIGFTPFNTGLRGADYKLAIGGTNQDGPYLFSLWTDILHDGTAEDTTAQIIFTIPASLGAGTYDVVGRDAMSNPNDIGVEIVTGFQTQRFGTDATGTLTIVANGGVGGVFSGEFEVTVGDSGGNTILANGRVSAISFLAQESAELVLSGAIDIVPSPEELIYVLARETSTAANNDWRLDVSTVNNETNPYIIQHRLYIVPNIAQGTYEIQPRVSPLDARPENMDVTAYVELFNVEDGTRIEGADISGTLEVITVRDTFTARFSLSYTINEGETVTAEGSASYMRKPAG